MMPAANQGVGMNTGFPDVCATPTPAGPVPIPYPNIGMNAMAMPFIPNVLVSMAPAQNMGSKPLMTNGDNAGVAHPMVMMPGGTMMGNPKILMGGMPAGHLLNPTYGNNMNDALGAKTVPSVTNVLLGALPAVSAGPDAAARLHGRPGAITLGAGDVAVLRLDCITLTADRWLAERLQELAVSSARGIVVDLRGNPGGAVATAHRLAAILTAIGQPLAIAVDRRTASAAELLAATLRERAGARVFGETSVGKGVARPHLVTAAGARPTGPFVAMPIDEPAAFHLHGIAPDRMCPADEAVDEAARWLRGSVR